MKRTFLIIGTIACLAATAAQAETRTSKEESIGVGIGATVGAVAGGPVGAIVGAAIGAKFGDNYHKKNEQVSELSGSLESSRQRVASLEQTVADLNGDISTMGGDLERLRAASRPELLSLMQAGIRMDLLFRTDERVLVDDTSERLEELAATLAAMPDVKVRLDGYADERGGEAYNDRLSADRAAHVRDLLVANGVAESRIAVAAHGESPAAQPTPDSYALERKVSLELFIEGVPSFASNPD